MVAKSSIEHYFKDHYDKFYAKYLPDIKKAGGNEFMSRCPFHADGKASFSINAQTGEYFCHGCGKKGHAFHFYAKLNCLDTKRDFGKILSGIAQDFGINGTQTQSLFVEAYDYTDADGNLVFQVCRYEPKSFKQRRPHSNGGWIYNLDNTSKVLYRLPEVIKAQEVIIVEGEKDADTIIELGFKGTTSPMGAKKWRDDFNPYLNGKV